jgi:hypothetical protein
LLEGVSFILDACGFELHKKVTSPRERPSSPLKSVSHDLLPNLATPTPPILQSTIASLEAPTTNEEDGVKVSQVPQEGAPTMFEDYLNGRQSSIEGDSLEGGEEVGNMDVTELEELLGWPPELLFIPAHGKCRKKESAGEEWHDIDNERGVGGKTALHAAERGGEREGGDRGGRREDDPIIVHGTVGRVHVVGLMGAIGGFYNSSVKVGRSLKRERVGATMEQWAGGPKVLGVGETGKEQWDTWSHEEIGGDVGNSMISLLVQQV